MPPKGQSKWSHLEKLRPHYLKCNICDLSIKCPKKVVFGEDMTDTDQEDEDQKAEDTDKEDKEHKIDIVKEVKSNIGSLTTSQKAAIVSLVFQSEQESLWDDQNKAACNLSQSSVQSITSKNADNWYSVRHPLLKVIADELSQVLFLDLSSYNRFQMVSI
jgi:hypothetical protein